MTRRFGRHLHRDDGRISVFVAILAPAFIALLGLVVDGGGKVRALQRADNIAHEAARAAGQAINATQAISGGTKEVDRAAAVAAAQSYIAATGATGTVTVDPGNLQAIRVDVSLTYDTVVIGFIGIDTVTVTGHATAVLLTG